MRWSDNDFSSVPVTAAIIGGGHNGLAISACLDEQGIDNVILERAEVANSWRTERWDSLRLLTPNWQCSLPGYEYLGPDPDGFMTAEEFAEFVADYAVKAEIPIVTQTTVTAVRRDGDLYQVITDRGVWSCRAVVLANGNFSIPRIPAIADAVPKAVSQLHSRDYQNAEQLDPGHVLVVGASATGLQLAKELSESGRRVTLAVGEHVRMPRCYRGYDIQFWLDVTGLLDEHYQSVDDLSRARRVPSPQLVGTTDHSTVDLNSLQLSGVELVGRLTDVRRGKLMFSGALANHCKLADLKLNRLIVLIDKWIEAHSLSGVDTAHKFESTRVPASPRLTLDLVEDPVNTIIWATGYQPDYSFLEVPVLDHRGRLMHDGGVVAQPGLYAMGMNFMRRRKSSFIAGATDDARDLSEHLANYVRQRHMAMV